MPSEFDNSFMDAIKSFEASGIGTGGASAQALDICGIYKKVKPILTGILPFLKLIPVYGGTVSSAITALMAVLNSTCPGS
jgi:hypothetical protein